jgi:Protein of unknown function (DUF3551)
MQPGDIAMRAVALLAVAGLAFIGQAQSSAAQSAYDYPWCAQRSDKSGALSCYYATYAQCVATLRGIGGSCIASPYYGGGRHVERWSHRH